MIIFSSRLWVFAVVSGPAVPPGHFTGQLLLAVGTPLVPGFGTCERLCRFHRLHPHSQRSRQHHGHRGGRGQGGPRNIPRWRESRPKRSEGICEKSDRNVTGCRKHYPTKNGLKRHFSLLYQSVTKTDNRSTDNES